jgi:membrane-associated phospholipid phosphatase
MTHTPVSRNTLLTILRPEETLLLGYGFWLLALKVITGVWRFTEFDHPRFLQCFAVLSGLVFIRAYIVARRSESARMAVARAVSPAVTVIRDFLPFFFGLLFYETLHDLTPVIRPDVVDPRLIAIDRAVFGVDVAYWMGQFASPVLTHVMVDCYATYFIAPGLLACAIYWKGDRVLFREYMVAMCVVTLLGYAGYLLVPAVGPYVYQAALFPTRLPGGEHTHVFIEQIDSMKGVARDCFPSMHTAHTTVVLAFAWRWSKKAFFGYLPIAVGLYVSTVYLRMHYVVDVAGGFAVAALAVWLGPFIERAWQRARARRIVVPVAAA